MKRTRAKTAVELTSALAMLAAVGCASGADNTTSSSTITDRDNDGIPDHLDDDNDNDGIPDNQNPGSGTGSGLDNNDGGTNPGSGSGNNGGGVEPPEVMPTGDVPPGDPSPAINISENNRFPSPYPPGRLTPASTPQIIVFGWDDLAFTGDHPSDQSAPDNGMNFIKATFGNIKNPDGKDGHVSFYQNGAYLPNSEPGGPWGSETNLMLEAGKELAAEGFEVGNHTFDHLETNGTWGKIPAQYKTSSLGGWAEQVGTILDKATWLNPVIMVNDQLLRMTYGVSQLYGFRAPRLEINGNGLMAVAEAGYLYETNMEEGLDWEHVTVATRKGQEQKGFKWVVWPHSLDNGSPGAWQAQDFGSKPYLDQFPKGLWEVPVYMVYIPDNGLQQSIAQRMKDEIKSEDTSWIGDRIREITAFDFNTFLYARLRPEEWVEIMKYNFLLRYNGNRAPMTFGAHPEQFSSRYDNEVLNQANNEDFKDVLNYNKYDGRKAAVKEFVEWVKTNYPNDAYFMSGKELIDFMKDPHDIAGNKVGLETLATPASDNLFQIASTWAVHKDELGSSGSVTVVDGNTINFEFNLANDNEAAGQYAFVGAASYFQKGALAAVSHFDIVYEAESPFRMRLYPEDTNQLSMQVLLAGTGESTARIRIQDFRPENYADPDQIAAADFVDANYMANVAGIGFEAAPATFSRNFKVQIKRIVVHGLNVVQSSPRLLPGSRPVEYAPERRFFEEVRAHTYAKPESLGSSVHWPAHAELHAH